MSDALDKRPSAGRYIVSAGLMSIAGMLSLGVIVVAWPPKMAISVAGSTSLVFEIADDDELQRGRVSMGDLEDALHRRLDPSGTQELFVRQYGERQVEIITPTLDVAALESIKRRISATGFLQFRIVANPIDHADVMALAHALSEDENDKRARVVRDETGVGVGLWVKVGRHQPDVDGPRLWKLSPSEFMIRDADTGEIIEVPANVSQHDGRYDDVKEMTALREFLDSRGTKSIEVLMATNDMCNVTGDHLGLVNRGFDESLNPCVDFTLVGEGVDLFADLTIEYSPSGNFTRQLGMVLDNTLLTAPNLQEMIVGHARITGRFTNEEVDFMVDILQAGSLPMALQDQPVSETFISPDPAAKDRMQMVLLSGLVVLLAAWTVMLVRYGWSGFAAGLAGLVQLLMTVAILLLVKVAFYVLPVGVLVFVALLSTASNAVLCELHRRALQTRTSQDRRRWSSFAIAIGLVALLFCGTMAVALVPYALGGFLTRNLAVILFAGSFSALVPHVCLWGVSELLSLTTATQTERVPSEES